MCAFKLKDFLFLFFFLYKSASNGPCSSVSAKEKANPFDARKKSSFFDATRKKATADNSQLSHSQTAYRLNSLQCKENIAFTIECENTNDGLNS